VIAAFQPHRFSRTRDLLAEFGAVLADADVTLLTDIYSAGEKPIRGVTAEAIAEAVRAHGRGTVELMRSLNAVAPRVAEIAGPGDVVLTLGAGSIGSIGSEIVAALEARTGAKTSAVHS
jgi:UDP-N-acetylmuramate--alanine ligase